MTSEELISDALSELTSRNDIGVWLTRNGLIGEAVEIGVHSGAYSEAILKDWSGTLHLVDPWARQDPEVYRDGCNDEDHDSVLREAKERLARFGTRAVFHQRTSDAAFHGFSANGDGPRFGLVHIDGNHGSEQVKRDIEQWWTLVVPGGVLSGHDFFEEIKDGVGEHCKDIAPIVRAFAAEHELLLHLTAEDFPVSWFVRKPL